jgi:nucleotide-binding universal stress UspA family protein
MMGAHGLGRVRISVLGAVIGRLSRLITTDLLVVKDERPIRNGRILVAVDGSAYSYVALRKAIGIARQFMCSIDVVSAFDPFYHYAAFNSIRYVLSAQAGKVFKFEEQEELHNNIIDRGLKTVCEANLMRADKVAADEGVEITSKVLVGKPFAKILEHIAETQPVLLVMGRYGAHHVDGADMGSNSDNLMRLAPCSVLMVGAVEAKPYDVPLLEQYEEEPLEWDPDAIQLVLRAPPFAQGMAKAGVEEYARKAGYTRVSLETLNTVLKGMLPPSMRHLMGLEQDLDRKISDARKFARSPIEEFSPHETIFNWSDEAKQRLNERVPTFIRPIAMLAMERYAREKGMDTVTLEVMVEVSRRLGYAADDQGPPSLTGEGLGTGPGALALAAAAATQDASDVTWTPPGEERLKKVPPFEREMVRKMVESMAKADGHTSITFEVADVTLKKIKEFYTAQSQGAAGYFAGMEKKGGQEGEEG